MRVSDKARARLRSILLLSIVVMISVIATLTIAFRKPGSSLTRDVRKEQGWDRMTAILDARVRQRFPVGTPIWQMTSQLEREGFAATWFEGNGEYGAKRDEGNWACNIVARVYWRPDADYRTIASIRATYREEGCL